MATAGCAVKGARSRPKLVRTLNNSNLSAVSIKRGHMGKRILVGLAATAMLVSCLVASSGCDKSSRSSSPNAPLSPVSPTPQPPAPQPSGEIIRLGEPVSGTITSQSICKFAGNDPRNDDLCQTFSVTAPENGTLVAAVRLTPDAATVLRFRTAAGEVIDAFCCSTTTGRVPVQAGSVVQIELAYVGRPSGYPSSVPPVAYTLETSLVTGDPQQRGDLRAIVFGDTTRTQRLAQARVEVLDGPSAGQVARFDEVSGLYELHDLPAGFIHVRTSAPGFNPVEEQLTVGAQLPRELATKLSSSHRRGTYALRKRRPLRFAEYLPNPGENRSRRWSRGRRLHLHRRRHGDVYTQFSSGRSRPGPRIIWRAHTDSQRRPLRQHDSSEFRVLTTAQRRSVRDQNAACWRDGDRKRAGDQTESDAARTSDLDDALHKRKGARCT